MYKKSNSEKEYVRTAITLSRLYGIAETLYPWKYLDNEKFITTMEKWTDELLRIDNPEKDILKFFESKINEYQKEQNISVIR